MGAHEHAPTGQDIIRIIEKNNDYELATILKNLFG
jgi:hypothetical protein